MGDSIIMSGGRLFEGGAFFMPEGRRITPQYPTARVCPNIPIASFHSPLLVTQFSLDAGRPSGVRELMGGIKETQILGLCITGLGGFKSRPPIHIDEGVD